MENTTFFTPVQELIQRVEERMHAQAEGHHSELGAALDHLLSSGGKRVRPTVSLLTGGMLGGDTERLVTLAAAIELLHTATLVHDDLIDGSLLRRGIPTLNAQWSPAATVLTGDFIFARAAGLAADTGSVEVMKMFADTLATIVNGEITQLFGDKDQITRENYYRRIHAKTASLFELASAAAAQLSPVDTRAIDKARTYGQEVGMAFQIVDDVLDFTGEQATVGKPVASDLRHGLITLPALVFMEMHPSDADIKALLNGDRYNEERVERAIESIRSSGAIERSMDEARRFIEKAVKAIAGFRPGIEHQSLEELAYYIVDRRK